MALPTMGGQSPSPEPVNMEEVVNPVVQQMKNLEKIAESIKSDLEGDTDLIDANLVNVTIFKSVNERVLMELGQLQSIQEGLTSRLASGEFSSKEERDALIRTANDLSKTRDSLDKFIKDSGKNSPIIKEMTAGLESFYGTLQVMADTAEYREVVAAKIDDLTWGQLKEEMRINAEEMRILEEKQKELDKQRAWFESAKSSMEQTEQIEAMKELVKAQKELDSSKERVKGRGEKLEEKRKEGVFGKFLKGLKESFDKVGEGLRNASRSWITKVFGALLVLGLLIKKGLISPKTIAKVLAFIVKVLISAVKMAIGLIFTGLMAIIDTIWELFKGGDYLAGFILALGTVIFGLAVLGKAITLVTSIWGGVVTGLSFLRTSLDMITNVFNSEFVKSMKGNLLGGVKNMFGGLSDSLKRYFNKFMPKKGAAAGGVPGLGGPKESKNFLGGLADTLKRLGTTEALKGALVLGILATSVFIVAKAFETFSKVSWEGVAIGLVSLYALIRMTKFVEKMEKDIRKGAAAIALLGVAMLTLGYGLAKFSEVPIEDIFKGLGALTALIYISKLVKRQSTAMIRGALAIAILGASLIPLAFGLSLISGVGFGQIIAFTVAVAALTGVAALAGLGFGLIALGAAAFALVGVGVLPLVLAFNLMSGVDLATVGTFVIAAGMLIGTAIVAGLASPLILLGSIAIAALGVGLLPFAFAMGILSGVSIDLAQVSLLDEAIRILAWRAVKEALLAPLVLVGSLAIGALGQAVIPFAMAMQALNGVNIDLTQVSNLDEAIRILSWRAVKEAAFVGPIALGAFAMMILGRAVQSFAPILETLQNTSPQNMFAFAESIGVLANTFAAAGLMFPLILLGSLSMLAMSKALNPIAQALAMVSGAVVDMEKVVLLSEAIKILARRAADPLGTSQPKQKKSGFFGFLSNVASGVADLVTGSLDAGNILTGATAIRQVGFAVIPFAKSLQMLSGSNVDANMVMALSFAIRTISLAAVFVAKFEKEAIAGSRILSVLGRPIKSISLALQYLYGIDHKLIDSFANAVKILVLSAVFAGKNVSHLFGGAVAITFLADHLQHFSKLLGDLKLDANSVESFVYGLNSLLKSAIFAGFNIIPIVFGSVALYLLGKSIRDIAESMSYIKGLNKSDVDSFIYGLDSLLNFISEIGVFGGIYLSFLISSISGGLKELGESLIPLSKAFGNMKGFDANILWDIADSMDYFLYSMSNLEFVNPYLFTDIFHEIMSIAPELFNFSKVLKMFNAEMEKTNTETGKFTQLFAGLGNIADPLYDLADSLIHLAYSLTKVRDSVSSMSDEEFSRVLRVASLINRSERNTSDRTQTTMSREISTGEVSRSGSSVNGREMSPRMKEMMAIRDELIESHSKAVKYASEILSRGGYQVSPNEIESVQMRANIPVKVKINGKEVSLESLHNEQERNQISAAVNIANAMKGSGLRTSSGLGAAGVSESIGPYESAVSGEVPRAGSSINGREIPIIVEKQEQDRGKPKKEVLMALELLNRGEKKYTVEDIEKVAVNDSMEDKPIPVTAYVRGDGGKLQAIQLMRYMTESEKMGFGEAEGDRLDMEREYKMVSNETTITKTSEPIGPYESAVSGEVPRAGSSINGREAQAPTETTASSPKFGDQDFEFNNTPIKSKFGVRNGKLVGFGGIQGIGSQAESLLQDEATSALLEIGRKMGVSVDLRKLNIERNEKTNQLYFTFEQDLTENTISSPKKPIEPIGPYESAVSGEVPRAGSSINGREIPVVVESTGPTNSRAAEARKRRAQLQASAETGRPISDFDGNGKPIEPVGPYKEAISGEVPRAGSSINGREIPVVVEKQGQDRGKPKKEVLMALELLNRGEKKYTVENIEKVVVNDTYEDKPMPVAAFVRDENGKLQAIQLMKYMTESEKIDFVSAEGERLRMERKNKIVDNTGTETTNERKPIEPVGPYESAISGEVSRSGSSINGREIPVVVESTGPINSRAAEARKRRAQLQASAETGRPISDFDGNGKPIGSIGPYKSVVSGEVENITPLEENIVSPSKNIVQSSGGRVLSEIRDILQETKNILAETFQGGGAGNAVIMQTQNTNVSNNNSSSGPIVRPMSTNDQYYTKMRFRHHI